MRWNGKSIHSRLASTVNDSQLARKFPRVLFIERLADNLADGKSFTNGHNRSLRHSDRAVNPFATVRPPRSTSRVSPREKFRRKRYQIYRREKIFSRYEKIRTRWSAEGGGQGESCAAKGRLFNSSLN